MSESEQGPREPELLPRATSESRQAIPTIPVYRSDDDGLYIPIPPKTRQPKRRLSLILFLLTCVSTVYAGANTCRVEYLVRHPNGAPVVEDGEFVFETDHPRSFLNGLIYAVAIMSILGAHEMGHYLQARRYGVPASLPMFIPMPISPFGTMGAVIVQQAGVADRKSMFDIAISGPLAGLVIALPLAWWGISMSRVDTILTLPGRDTPIFPDPLILKWIVRSYFGELRPNQDVILNPILFAGWVGIFITGLNLLPIGQLDGGHILYCILKKRANKVARVLFMSAVAFVVYNSFFGNRAYQGWWLMLALLWMVGTRHPPTADDNMPLGKGRIVLGWLTLMFIFVGFSPRPPYEIHTPPLPHHEPPKQVVPRDPEKEIQA